MEGVEEQVSLQHLTITDLDTGDVYVIGQNEPQFDFDTFEQVQVDKINAKPITNDQHWTDVLWTYLTSIFSSTDITRVTDSNVTVTTLTDSNLSASERKINFNMKDFKFTKELGRGAFGIVVLAVSQKTNEQYAVKIISKKDMKNSQRRQAMAERDVLAAMGRTSPHPFTTGLKFAFQSENNLYLGMDYLPGGDMRKFLTKHKALQESWVRFYISEIILALSHLHSLNVLYRDIKPHNVMLDRCGHVVLVDYGLAKQNISHPRGAQSLVGTPDYSAPEVLQTGVYRMEMKRGGSCDDNSRIGYGKAADWWSVGVLTYEMIAGYPPFRGRDLRQTYRNILYGRPSYEPREVFSAESESFIRGLLERDPALRLGAWDTPPVDIMKHQFFQGMDWDRVLSKQMQPPWLPPAEKNSTCNFKFTHENSQIVAHPHRDEGDEEAEERRTASKHTNTLTNWSYWDVTVAANLYPHI